METPFHMIVVGMTECAKTHFLLEMLEKDYKGHFEYIFLICLTFEWNKRYQEWRFKKDKNFIVLPCEQDEVEGNLETITNLSKGTNSLIILDNCASGRHYGLSTIVITQQLTSIAKPYREQISKIVVFLPSSNKDLKFIFDEYLSDLDKNEQNSIKKTLKSVRYARLEFCRRIAQGYTVYK